MESKCFCYDADTNEYLFPVLLDSEPEQGNIVLRHSTGQEYRIINVKSTDEMMRRPQGSAPDVGYAVMLRLIQ